VNSLLEKKERKETITCARCMHVSGVYNNNECVVAVIVARDK
jgi:hypothetical protein